MNKRAVIISIQKELQKLVKEAAGEEEIVLHYRDLLYDFIIYFLSPIALKGVNAIEKQHNHTGLWLNHQEEFIRLVTLSLSHDATLRKRLKETKTIDTAQEVSYHQK